MTPRCTQASLQASNACSQTTFALPWADAGPPTGSDTAAISMTGMQMPRTRQRAVSVRMQFPHAGVNDEAGPRIGDELDRVIRRNKCHSYDVTGKTIAEFDDSARACRGREGPNVDFDIVVVEEYAVERIHRLVDGLLDDEQKTALVRIDGDAPTLALGCDKVEQIGVQRLRRLDIDSETAEIAAPGNGRD